MHTVECRVHASNSNLVLKIQNKYANAANSKLENETLVDLKLLEVSKAQLEVQSATSSTSAIAEVALRLNFFFQNIAEIALQTIVFKNCCVFKVFSVTCSSAILYRKCLVHRTGSQHKTSRAPYRFAT